MNESAEYDIRLKTQGFTSPLKSLESKMNHFEGKVSGLQSSFGGLGSAMVGAFAATAVFAGVTALGSKILKLGMDMEQTRVSFETMLGSSDKASGFIAQLQTFARVTPYVTSEVLSAGKQMLAFGFASGEVIPQLTKLGDVASGLNIPLGDMIYLYGTLKTTGRAMTKDIVQFAQRGIPIYEALAKVLGVTKEKVGDLVTDGKVGFDQVSKAFELMTQKGSQFGGLMDKQSHTLAGRWSTFEGTLEEIGTTLGEKMLPYAGKVVDAFSSLAEILPKLDFSAITYSLEQAGDAVSYLGGIVSDLFSLFGVNMDGLTSFQLAMQGIAFSVRALTTPLRFAVDLIRILVTTIKAAAPIFTEVGKTFANFFTGNFKGVLENGKNLQKLAGEFKDTMSNAIGDVISKEGEGWKKVFSLPGSGSKEGAKEGANGAFGSGSSSSTSGKGGKASNSGVEKISAGTRNVTITIAKLVENVNISKTLDRMGNSEIVDVVKKALLTAVNDVNIVQQ